MSLWEKMTPAREYLNEGRIGRPSGESGEGEGTKRKEKLLHTQLQETIARIGQNEALYKGHIG